MRVDFWNRNRPVRFTSNSVETAADAAARQFLELVKVAPPTPGDWPTWPEHESTEFIAGEFEVAPGAIALHHASWAIAWAEAVERLLLDQETAERREIREWIKQYEDNPEYSHIFRTADGRRIKYVEDTVVRRDWFGSGVRHRLLRALGRPVKKVW